MKRKIPLLFICFTTSGLAFAAEVPTENMLAEEQSKPVVPETFISSPIWSEIEFGLGFVSDDAYKFGRYNGMQTDGVFVVGDIKIKSFEENGDFWNLRATNLGLESRYLKAEGGTQGKYQFSLEYDELPNYKSNTVQSPYLGIGSNDLTLPAGFDITDMDADLNDFELKTKRERIKVGAMFIPTKHWQFDIDFSRSNKQGVDATGASIASSSSQVIGNTSTSLVAKPIDQDTDLINATVSYAGDEGQVDLKYHVSLFKNNYDSMTWDNAHPLAPTSAGPLPPSGGMSLAPDNEFHQLSLTGGYTLPYKTRLTGFLAMGRMTQNQGFDPYTVNTSLTGSALPSDSLDGEVWMSNAQLKLAARPSRKLRLNMELLYKERDNKTSVNTYDYIVLDSHNAINEDGSPKSVTNRPYSYKNNRFNLLANFRFNSLSNIRGGYKYNNMKRNYVDVEREETDERTIFVKWKVKAHSTVDFSLLGETSDRDGSEYNSAVGENPAMRKYHLADRVQDKVAATLDIMATEKLFLSATTEYNNNEYSESTVGLTDSSQPVYTIDFTYQPTHNISTYGYYTNEVMESTQVSEDVSPSATQIWEADFEDTFNTVGIGAKISDLGKWDIGVDLTYSESDGVIEMTDLKVPGTEVQYPDTKTELSSAQIWTRYQHNKQLGYKLGLAYEKYNADNWALDDLQPYDPARESLLLLGNDTQDYDVYVVTVSALYNF